MQNISIFGMLCGLKSLANLTITLVGSKEPNSSNCFDALHQFLTEYQGININVI